MSAPTLRRGDLIHIAIPDLPTRELNIEMSDKICAAYRRLGIAVFMIDHIPDATTVHVVSVIRGEGE